MILSIFSKLGLEYAIFVYTFHITRFTSGETKKIPSLDLFIESLMHEIDKFIKMGAIKSSKAHALTAHERNKSNLKTKQKGKGKKYLKQRKDPNFKAFDEYPSTPKVESESKERQSVVTAIATTTLNYHA
jgi:hypothetical protein